MLAEEEFDKLNQIVQYSSKVEPMKFHCHLVTGVLLTVIFIIFFIHMFAAGSVMKDQKAIHPFLNMRLEKIYQNQNLGFMASVIFVVIGYYLLMCTMHGNLKVGIRFLAFTFYPVKPQETMMNSFLINAMLMNAYMYSLTYYIADIFSPYLRGSQAAIFF